MLPLRQGRENKTDMRIGQYQLRNNLFLAPMAGVTDRPFRTLCRRLGAGMAASEMVSSNSLLWGSEKTLAPRRSRRRIRAAHGADRRQRPGADGAGGARQCRARRADHRHQHGLPGEKICNVYAGSALLQNEQLVSEILGAVVKAVDVPVTLKIRTGWDRAHKNGAAIARVAEDCGIQALAVHGRTRSDLFQGEAEYDTIAAIKQAVKIPIVANGDIASPKKAAWVLKHTGADGVMIGRAAQGNPWIFREISHFLATGTKLAPPPVDEVRDIVAVTSGKPLRVLR